MADACSSCPSSPPRGSVAVQTHLIVAIPVYHFADALTNKLRDHLLAPYHDMLLYHNCLYSTLLHMTICSYVTICLSATLFDITIFSVFLVGACDVAS